MRRSLVLCTLLTLPLLSACAGRSPFPTVAEDGLELDTVVLYRNGVGYFERRGKVDGDSLRLRVRKDQVNDLLKSLTVVDKDGKAVSVSMPLDPADVGQRGSGDAGSPGQRLACPRCWTRCAART